MKLFDPIRSIQEAKIAIEKGNLVTAFNKVDESIRCLVEKSIGNGELGDIHKKFILLSGQFYINDSEKQLQLSEIGFTTQNRNRIAEALLNLAEELDKIALSHEEATQATPNKERRNQIVLILELDDENFDQVLFLKKVSDLIESNSVFIKKIEIGSIKITLDIPDKAFKKLENLTNSGQIKDWKFKSLEYLSSYDIDPQFFKYIIDNEIRYLVSNTKLVFNATNFGKIELPGADLSDIIFIRVDFRKASLDNTIFTNSYLSDANLDGTSLKESNFNNAHLREATLNDAQLSKATFIRAYLGRTEFKGANLSRADLMEADLIEANLIGANLTGAKLIRGNLTRANLSRAILNYTNFNKAILVDATFSNTDLTGANLSEADLRGVNLSTANLDEVNLKNATFYLSQKQQLLSLGIDTSIIHFIDDDAPFHIGVGVNVEV